MNILQTPTACRSLKISILCPKYPQGGGGYPPLRKGEKSTLWSEPSNPSPPSPSAGPSRPHFSAEDLAAETPDGRSPPTSPRGSYATFRAAHSATASLPADTSPR